MNDFDVDYRKRTWWYLALWLSPPLVLALVTFVSLISGIFDGLPLVGQQVTWQQGALILGAMFGPVVAGCYCHMMWNRARARLSRNWPQVDGYIESNRIYEYQDWLVPWRRVSRLKITYRYTIDACDYVGHRVQFGFQLISPEIGKTLVARFAIGAQAPVRYDPKAPDDAVLDCADQMASYRSKAVIWYFLAVYAFFIVGLAISSAIS